LTEDTELRALYTEALAKYGKETFSRNHNRLLKRLLKDLRLQSKSNAQIQTIRMLRRRAHRVQVTDLISIALQPSNSAATRPMQRLQDQKPDHWLTLNQLLQKDVSGSQASYDREGTKNNEDILVEISEDEDDGSHESSEDGEDDPAPELRYITVGNSDNAQDIKEELDLKSAPTEFKVELDLKSTPTESKSATDTGTKMSSSHHSSTRKRKHSSSSKLSKKEQDGWSSTTEFEERRQIQNKLAEKRARKLQL
jgi:hypothetical protein